VNQLLKFAAAVILLAPCGTLSAQSANNPTQPSQIPEQQTFQFDCPNCKFHCMACLQHAITTQPTSASKHQDVKPTLTVTLTPTARPVTASKESNASEATAATKLADKYWKFGHKNRLQDGFFGPFEQSEWNWESRKPELSSSLSKETLPPLTETQARPQLTETRTGEVEVARTLPELKRRELSTDWDQQLATELSVIPQQTSPTTEFTETRRAVTRPAPTIENTLSLQSEPIQTKLAAPKSITRSDIGAGSALITSDTARTTTTGTAQSTITGNAKASKSVKTLVGKTVRTTSRRQKKASGAFLWSWLPWLTLPILGWFGWRYFDGKKKGAYQEETITAATTSSNRASLPVVDARPTLKNRTPVKTETFTPVKNSALSEKKESAPSIATTTVENRELPTVSVTETKGTQKVAAEMDIVPEDATDSTTQFDSLRPSIAEVAQTETCLSVTSDQSREEADCEANSFKLIPGDEPSTTRYEFDLQRAQQEETGISETTKGNSVVPASKTENSSSKGKTENLESQRSQNVRKANPTTGSSKSTNSAKTGTDDLTRVHRSSEFESIATTMNSSSTDTSEQDDLTLIRGIGPATQKLLAASGITSFKSLYESSTDRLQQILSSGGSRFKLIDPSLWTQQARFAMNKNWTGLTQWQSENCIEEAPKSKTESAAYQQPTASGKPDDLTQIRGIGPATQRVLRENGVQSFDQVAKMNSDQLGELFADLETQFRLIDTTTWPSQAQEFVNERSGTCMETNLLNEVNSIRNIASTANANLQDAEKATTAQNVK